MIGDREHHHDDAQVDELIEKSSLATLGARLRERIPRAEVVSVLHRADQLEMRSDPG